MSYLVLGAAQFGLNYGINNKNGQISVQETSDILQLAWENNIREIDTAQAYGSSELCLNKCLKIIPNNFLIHSKFILKDYAIQLSVNESLANLGIAKIGYFYFHHFSDYQLYRSQNKVGSIEPLKNSLGLAVSVYEEDELALLLDDTDVFAIQVPLNVFDCSDKKIQLIQKAQEKGKKIYIRSVFLQGLIFMEINDLPLKLQSFAEPILKLNQICQKYNLDKKSLALGFVKKITSDCGILIGVDSKEQLRENISSWKTELTSEIINEIRNINILDKKLLLPKNWN